MPETTTPHQPEPSRAPAWTCPACAYTTDHPNDPGHASLLRHCTLAEVETPTIIHSVDFAVQLCVRDMQQAHTRRMTQLYATLPDQDKAQLDQWTTDAISEIQERLGGKLVRALLHRDVEAFLWCHPDLNTLGLVHDTHPVLLRLGLYDICLLHGLTEGRINLHHWSAGMLQYLVGKADRARMRLAWPLRQQPPLTLYRGVAGRGPARRIRGLSWTGSLEKAWWFARRFPHLHDPAVYQAVVADDHILAYTNARQEDEYLVTLPRRYPVTREGA